jgi:hypothetical protein
MAKHSNRHDRGEASDRADEPFLWKCCIRLYMLPQGHPPFPHEILQESEISRYVQGWGKPDDLGFAALVNEQMAVAEWDAPVNRRD